MPTRTAFLLRCVSALAISFSVILLVGSAAALPPVGMGGGGGGFGGGHGFGGGGHFGGHSGGKSGSAKSVGHLGWLHLGGHSNRNARSGVSSIADSSPFWSSSLWSSIGFTRSFSAPPTMLLNQPVASFKYGSLNSFAAWRRGDYPHSFPKHPFPRFRSSGCFFNGSTQVCFFVPLFAFCGFSDGFYFDAGFDGAFGDSGDGSGDNSDEPGQAGMDTIPPANDMADAAGNNSAETGTRPGESSVGNGQLVLVLKNGVQYGVSDYWVADGYLEYTITDGTRSQVPLESLDVEATVAKNAPRGISFVLRSSPGQNRQ